MDEKTLTVSRIDAAMAAAKLLPVLQAKNTDTTRGLVSMSEKLAHAECFEVQTISGAVVGYYAIEIQQREAGAEVVVIAACGKMSGADLVATFIPYIEKQAHGAKAITVHTRRKGLLSKLCALGFGVDGFILRKALT